MRAGHVVGDDGGLDAVPEELPGGEPGALEQWPRLIGQHGDPLSRFHGAADDAERGAVSGGRQSAGIAVGQNRGVHRHDLGAEGSDRAATGEIFDREWLVIPGRVDP